MFSHETLTDCPQIDLHDFGDHTISSALFWESHMSAPDVEYFCGFEPRQDIHATVLA